MTSNFFPINDHVMFSDDGIACLAKFLVLDRLVVSCLESIPMHPFAWQSSLCLTGLLLAVLNPFRFHPAKCLAKFLVLDRLVVSCLESIPFPSS